MLRNAFPDEIEVCTPIQYQIIVVKCVKSEYTRLLHCITEWRDMIHYLILHHHNHNGNLIFPKEIKGLNNEIDIELAFLFNKYVNLMSI